jgi:hypothetical protein
MAENKAFRGVTTDVGVHPSGLSFVEMGEAWRG